MMSADLRQPEGTMMFRDRRKPTPTFLVLAIALLPLQGMGQNPFPEGPARDTIVLVCSQCHPLTRLIDSNKSAGDWDFILYDMIARGAPVHENQINVVRQYLIDNFAVDGR